jgi:hypothetical protein
MNSNNWKEFNFNGIFKIERGQRLIKRNQIMGEIAYISSTKTNNGIDNYILPHEKMKIYKNKMTLSNSGSVGYCFFHNYNFAASDHVTVIDIKDKKVKLNIYVALFVKPIIQAMKYKYNFGREISNKRLKKETIKLPVGKNRKPDWQFMENYIKNLSPNVYFHNKNIQTPKIKYKSVDTKNWKDFEYEKIFSCIKRGKRLIEKDRVGGETMYYSASGKNNGLTDNISNPLFTESDALIYSTFGDCFYISGEFTASDEITIFKHNKLNKYNGLFIATIVKQNKYKYNFGRKAFYNKYIDDTIKLPADKNGNPDWQFMENYIKSLPYSSNL